MKIRNLSSTQKKTVTLDLSQHNLLRTDVELVDHNNFRFGNKHIEIDQTTIIEILGRKDHRYRISGPAGIKHFYEFCESLPATDTPYETDDIEEETDSPLPPLAQTMQEHDNQANNPSAPLEAITQKPSVLAKISRLEETIKTLEENQRKQYENNQKVVPPTQTTALQEDIHDVIAETDNTPNDAENTSPIEAALHIAQVDDTLLKEKIAVLEQEKLHLIQEKQQLEENKQKSKHIIAHLEQEFSLISTQVDQLIAAQKTSKKQTNEIASQAESTTSRLTEEREKIVEEHSTLQENYRQIEERLSHVAQENRKYEELLTQKQHDLDALSQKMLSEHEQYVLLESTQKGLSEKLLQQQSTLEQLTTNQQSLTAQLEAQHVENDHLKQELQKSQHLHQRDVSTSQTTLDELKQLRITHKQLQQSQASQQDDFSAILAENKQQMDEYKQSANNFKKQYIMMETALMKERSVRRQMEEKLVELETKRSANGEDIELAQREMATKVLSDLSGDKS